MNKKVLGVFLLTLIVWSSTIAQPTSSLDSMTSLYYQGPKDASSLPLLLQICADHPSSTGRMLFAREMLKIAEAEGNRDYMHRANLEIGIAYRIQGILSESTSSLFKSLEIASLMDDLSRIGESLGEISSSFSAQGDTKNAVRYINKAINIFRQEKDSLNLCIALLNTGYDYHMMNKTDSALIYYFEADDIASQASFGLSQKASLLAFIRGNRGITQAKIGMAEEGIAAIRKSIQILSALDDREAIVDYNYQLAKILHANDSTDVAMRIAQQALLESSILNVKSTMKDVSILLYRMHLSKNDYKNALRYRLAHEAIKDSIQNANVFREMAEQRTEYEVGLKQAEVDILDIQKKNQNIISVSLGIVLFIMIMASLLVYRNYRQKAILSTQLEKKRLDLEALNATKDKLFSIVSHDLRGPITAFSSLSRIVRYYVKSKKIDELLELADEMDDSAQQLNNMLENLLAWTIHEQGQLELNKQSISLSELFADLQKIYRGMLEEKNLNLQITVDEDVKVEADWNTLHAAVRNLLSNAIKFTSDGGTIELIAQKDNALVNIQVCDTGVGIAEDKKDSLFKLDATQKSSFGTNGEKGLGLGLKIVYEFVNLNSGNLTVSSKEGQGTVFSISIPS
jgi:signal transduction histidine kinase